MPSRSRFASPGAKLALALARGLRVLPRFKGKGSLGLLAQRLLLDFGRDDDSVISFPMKDGLEMTVDLRSEAERTAFWTGEYDAPKIALLKRFLVPGCLVLDVGANVGFYALSLGRALKDLGGRLIAFEPVPANLARLRHHIGINALSAVVEPIAVALGREEGTARLRMTQPGREGTGNASMLLPAETSDHFITTPLTRLDALARERDLSDCVLIKLDIEGGEHAFLLGAMDFLARNKPVIQAEFNGYWMKHFGWSADDVKELLRPLGYRLYRMDGGELSPLDRHGAGNEDVLMIQERHRSLLGLG